jgi:PAS domain S-box-containing protein
MEIALENLTREELVAEVARLRTVLDLAEIDPDTAISQIQPAREQHRQRPTPAQSGASKELPETLQASLLALAGSEARQRAIFESVADFAIILTDTAGIITDWNAGAEKVMGWTAEEMRGQSAERFFTPADRACDWFSEEMQTALREGRALDERWHLRKDGQQFWAAGELSPIHDEEGTHLGFMKILRDRTSEHLAGLAAC